MINNRDSSGYRRSLFLHSLKASLYKNLHFHIITASHYLHEYHETQSWLIWTHRFAFCRKQSCFPLNQLVIIEFCVELVFLFCSAEERTFSSESFTSTHSLTASDAHGKCLIVELRGRFFRTGSVWLECVNLLDGGSVIKLTSRLSRSFFQVIRSELLFSRGFFNGFQKSETLLIHFKIP